MSLCVSPFFWGKSCWPEKRLPVSWLGRVKAWLASFLKAGGEEGWSLSIWFACVSLTLPFSLWHPCLCLYMVFPSPDTLLFHRTETKPIFCQDEEGSTLVLQVQERGLIRTHNASVPPGSSLATSTGGWCVCTVLIYPGCPSCLHLLGAPLLAPGPGEWPELA